MFETIQSALDQALGLHLEAKDLGALHMSLRALIVFGAATAYIRIGSRRFIGRSTSFDVVLGIIFGSVVSRAVTGNAPFGPTLAAGLTLVALHWILSAIAFRSHRFGNFVKGVPRVLVRDGEIQWKTMAECHISQHDLDEALRVHGLPPDVSRVRQATMERNGDISVIPREPPRLPVQALPLSR